MPNWHIYHSVTLNSPAILIRPQILAKLPSLSHLANHLNLIALVKVQLILSGCDKLEDRRHRWVLFRRWARRLSGHLRRGETLLRHGSWRSRRWRWIGNVGFDFKKTAMMTLWLPYVWLDRAVIVVGIRVAIIDARVHFQFDGRSLQRCHVIARWQHLTCLGHFHPPVDICTNAGLSSAEELRPVLCHAQHASFENEAVPECV